MGMKQEEHIGGKPSSFSDVHSLAGRVSFLPQPTHFNLKIAAMVMYCTPTTAMLLKCYIVVNNYFYKNHPIRPQLP